MKKFFQNALKYAVVLGVVAGFAACSSDDDDEKTKEVSNVVITTPNQLVLTANVSATFSLNGQTKTGQSVTFDITSSRGTVTVSAADRETKQVSFNFNGAKYLALNVELAAKTKEVAQTAAESGAEKVDNSGKNQTETGVAASISFEGGATNTNKSVTGDYSITVTTPASTDVDPDALTGTIEEPALALLCEPSGATFPQDKPVLLQLTIPGSEGMDISASFEGKKEQPATLEHKGNVVTIGVTHFSTWEINLEAVVASKTERIQTYTATGDASTGSLSYQFDDGFDTATSNPFILKWANQIFGAAKHNVSRTVTFQPVSGTANLTCKQTVTTYNFTSGTQSFTIIYYGPVEESLSLTVAENVAPTIRTHSGGSND